jgi:chromosome segregation ATPase
MDMSSSSEPKPVTAAREQLAAVEHRLDEYERAGSQARRSIGDLESQVTAALFQSGVTGEAASVDDLRRQIALAQQTSIDSEQLAAGAKRAVAAAQQELAKAINTAYPAMSAKRDQVARELVAEQADIAERVARHQDRVNGHVAAWDELLQAQGADRRSLRRDAAGALRLDDTYSPLDRIDQPKLKVAS